MKNELMEPTVPRKQKALRLYVNGLYVGAIFAASIEAAGDGLFILNGDPDGPTARIHSNLFYAPGFEAHIEPLLQPEWKTGEEEKADGSK